MGLQREKREVSRQPLLDWMGQVHLPQTRAMGGKRRLLCLSLLTARGAGYGVHWRVYGI